MKQCTSYTDKVSLHLLHLSHRWRHLLKCTPSLSNLSGTIKDATEIDKDGAILRCSHTFTFVMDCVKDRSDLPRIFTASAKLGVLSPNFANPGPKRGKGSPITTNTAPRARTSRQRQQISAARSCGLQFGEHRSFVPISK